MESYNPLVAPDVPGWLALDEGERIGLVEEFHRRARVKLPNRRMHAAIHAVVENQIAEKLLPVLETLERFMSDGLDRHEAVHAIGYVLSGVMYNIMKDKAQEDPNPEYFRKLKEFTVEAWRKSGGEPDED